MLRLGAIRPVSELLDDQAGRRPEAPAVRDEAGPVGYRELAERTARLAGHLAAMGVEPGDRVGLYMTNSTGWVTATLGTVRAGAVSVPIPAQVTPEDTAFMLADADARVLLTDAAHLDAAREAAASRPGLEVLADPELERLTSEEPPARADRGTDLDVASWILYTSGTTGRPKGVLLTQRGMTWVVAAGWLPFLEWTEGDMVLCPLPLTHSYPLDATLAAITVGATQYVIGAFSPSKVADILRTEPVTVLLGVPTIFTYLMAELERSGRPLDSALRMCVSAGAVLPPDVSRRAEEVLGAPMIDAYGATEASTAITMSSPKGERPPGSCGVSLPGMAVRVVDPETLADRAPDEEGEVIARGPGIMLGYHNRPEETSATLRGGWYHTGDLGRLDAAGNLAITGRLKDIIIRGGENIAPAEIERVAIEHPAVQDCAVVGVQHATLGEVPVLAIVAGGADVTDSVAALCDSRLPSFKRPDRIVVVDAVPRTGSGKVMRHRLRAAIEVPAS